MNKDIKYFTSTSFRRGYSIDITQKYDFNINKDITYAQSYYSIVLLRNSMKKVHINFKQIPTTDNLFVIRPEDIVYCENIKGDIEFIEMCLDDTFFDLLSEKEDFKAAYPFIFTNWKANSWHINDTLFNILEKKLLTIKSILETRKGVKDKYFVFAIFIECITLLSKSIEDMRANEETGESGNSRTLPLINKFYALIDKHFRTEANVAFYADELCVTTNNLCRTIKAITGKTTKQIITLRKTHEAQRLLAYSEKDICDIAMYLGYPDTKEFCRVFKKQTGLLPTEYRNKTR